MAVLTLEVSLRNFLQSFMLAFTLSEMETKNSREWMSNSLRKKQLGKYLYHFYMSLTKLKKLATLKLRRMILVSLKVVSFRRRSKYRNTVVYLSLGLFGNKYCMALLYLILKYSKYICAVLLISDLLLSIPPENLIRIEILFIHTPPSS